MSTTPSTPAESPPRGASAAEDVGASTPTRRAEDTPASTPPRVSVTTSAAASLSPYSQQQQRRLDSPSRYPNDLDRPFLNSSSAAVDLDDFGRPRLPFHVVLLRSLFKTINVFLLITGIAMIGAAADELVRFQQTAAPELKAKAPWFLFAVGGAGAAISLTASLGLAAASASSGRRWMRRRRRSRGRRMLNNCFCCCPAPPTAFLLGAYAAVLSALLVFQFALALALSADATWRKTHLPEDPTGDEEALAALIARQLWAARSLAAVALALQLFNVGIAGALGSAHVSALEAAAEGRAFVAAEGRYAAAAASALAAAREGSYLDDEPGWGATPAPRLPSSPARGTFIPISSSPEQQSLLLPPSMQRQQQQEGSSRGCLLM